MSTQTRVTLSLPPGVVRRLDRAAAGARRSRSNAAAVLLDSALAGKQRLAELARLATETAAESDPTADATREGVAEHLDQHAEIGGLTTFAPEK